MRLRNSFRIIPTVLLTIFSVRAVAEDKGSHEFFRPNEAYQQRAQRDTELWVDRMKIEQEVRFLEKLLEADKAKRLADEAKKEAKERKEIYLAPLSVQQAAKEMGVSGERLQELLGAPAAEPQKQSRDFFQPNEAYQRRTRRDTQLWVDRMKIEQEVRFWEKLLELDKAKRLADDARKDAIERREIYFAPLSVQQAAKEMGISEERLKVLFGR
jgi:hypothetical protein